MRAFFANYTYKKNPHTNASMDIFFKYFFIKNTIARSKDYFKNVYAQKLLKNVNEEIFFVEKEQKHKSNCNSCHM